MNAVLLDAMGTLLELDRPAARLRDALRERTGIDVPEPDCRRALGAEIAYYRSHHLEGDEAGLAALRSDCARVLQAEVPQLLDAQPQLVRDALLDALRFRAHADARLGLRRLRAAGLQLIVVSNWDVSLVDALEAAGLAPLLDGVVTSAGVGAAKPDPTIFRRALALADVPASAALHVGDSPVEDVAGARAAGIRAALLRRAPTEHEGLVARDVPVVQSLDSDRLLRIAVDGATAT